MRASPMISATASEPKTAKRAGMFATAPNPLSIATEAPFASTSDALKPSSAVQTCSLAVLIRAHPHVDPPQRLHLGHLGRADVAQAVDGMRAPRADPTTAERAVEQPAPRPQRNPGAGRNTRHLHVFDPTEHAVGDHLPQPGAGGFVPELEVAQRDHTGGPGFSFELDRFVGIEGERLVAEHRLARREREPHVRRVQKRRRVHADEIDVGSRHQRAHHGVVAGRDHVDHLAAFGAREHRRDHALPEASADDRDLHSPSTSGVSSETGRWKRRSPACVTGPIVNARSSVPTPTLPPRRYPASSALHSRPVRTTQMR